MTTFGDLKPDTYYLIQIDDESDIELVSVLLVTKETVLLRSYLPQAEDFFQYKEEVVFRLVEEFDQETAEKFLSLYQEETTEAQEYFEFEEDEVGGVQGGRGLFGSQLAPHLPCSTGCDGRRVISNAGVVGWLADTPYFSSCFEDLFCGVSRQLDGQRRLLSLGLVTSV